MNSVPPIILASATTSPLPTPRARPVTARATKRTTSAPPWPSSAGGPEGVVNGRPEVRGKFLFVGGRKFWVKGVTYGTFRPNDQEDQFPDRDRVDADFAQMAASGFNTVRVYTPPPRWLLDVAETHGLKVMVGLPWAQHVAFLDEPGLADTIVKQLRADVRTCAGHAALLCFAVGNEIPARS